MNRALRAAGLLAGMAAFNILLNIHGFSWASPVASLLDPSVDLLVLMAILMTAALVNQRAHVGFAVGVAVLLALYVGWQVFQRWGAPLAAGRIALIGLAALVAGVVSFFLSRLVVRGFDDATLRSLFLLAAACCVIIQALLGVRIFSSSVVPGLLGFR
jgi:hypothetical protein